MDECLTLMLGDVSFHDFETIILSQLSDPNIGADAIPPPSPGTPTEEMENETRHYCPGCMSNFDDKEQFQQHLGMLTVLFSAAKR